MTRVDIHQYFISYWLKYCIGFLMVAANLEVCQDKTSQVTLLVARGHTQNLFFPGDRPGERRERRLQCTPHIHLAPLSQ